jgi:hypothetical protein
MAWVLLAEASADMVRDGQFINVWMRYQRKLFELRVASNEMLLNER